MTGPLHPLLRLCGPAVAATLAAGLAAAPAAAQQVGKAAEKSEWLSVVIGGLLVAIVCVGAFMGSKRGHLD
ncbi:hypothetical protein [Phycisphaera mikurensis]|uniref:Uncharacterized protein n=1 Tax=Phycisphaera mikurensis (strain NBRC 102666 / KCTC 22515 / FYK2301M01) TaxID=1142394 RepID=I0IEH3_PHYMF|nr:hypothetical protein [Phycisphaera mikurensis]MBB6441460.1 hypothetical protein [Phycisphaera mikurensis]BAM03661.1 hypothetical protein PSMK_15020 [Phycisphaera mikurensis NBRC 102666]